MNLIFVLQFGAFCLGSASLWKSDIPVFERTNRLLHSINPIDDL